MTHILCQINCKCQAYIVYNKYIHNNSHLLTLLPQNNKSAKVYNIDQVKLEFNNDDLDDNENKIIELSKNDH